MNFTIDTQKWFANDNRHLTMSVILSFDKYRVVREECLLIILGKFLILQKKKKKCSGFSLEVPQ